MTQTNQPKERTNFSAMIRQMLHEGKTHEEIKEALGVSNHLIYNVRYYATKKAKRQGVRMSAKTGKFMRKYTKRSKPEQPEAQVETTIDTAPTTPILSDEETKYQQEVRRSRPGRDIVPDTPQVQAALGYTTVSEAYVTGLENQCASLKAKNRDLKLNNDMLKAEVGALRTQARVQTRLEADHSILLADHKTLEEAYDALRNELQTMPEIIEVKVPQPFSHYTFWQRLRIVFLGRA